MDSKMREEFEATQKGAPLDLSRKPDGAYKLPFLNVKYKFWSEAWQAAIASADSGKGQEPIYQVWCFDGGWRDVSKEVYEKESHREDVRIVYTHPSPAQDRDRVINYAELQRVADTYGLDYNKFCAATAAYLSSSPAQDSSAKDSAVQQAKIWAQEARTQQAIVKEIGELVGCQNDWEMVSAVKSALAAQDSKVPEGWKLVPEKPTDKMINAWFKAPRYNNSFNHAYTAMLSAAPTHPEQPLAMVADKPQFPVMLRKMWSGSEVQAWIDEHWPTGLQRPEAPEVE